MRSAQILKLVMSVGIALSTAGCVEGTGSGGSGGVTMASFSPAAGKTKAELELERQARSLRQQSSDIIVRNTIQGALAGAAVGCALGFVIGGNERDCARGAAVGAIGGGIGGNAIGREAARKNEQMVAQRQAIAQLRGFNAKLSGVQGSLNSVLRAQNREIASLRAKLRAKQISENDYRSRINAINSTRADVSNSLASAQSNLSTRVDKAQSVQKQTGVSMASFTGQARQTESRLARMRKSIAIIPTS